MKPRNWRKYYGYRPDPVPHYPKPKPYVYSYKTPPLRRLEHDANENIDQDYIDWLCKRRGWNEDRAWAYCEAMDKRTIISQSHGGATVAQTAPAAIPAPRPPSPAPAPLRCARTHTIAPRALRTLQSQLDTWRARADDYIPGTKHAAIAAQKIAVYETKIAAFTY